MGLWGHFGAGNWGNECTLQAIVHNVHRHAPEAELVCICSEPTDTRHRHGLPSVPISRSRRVGVFRTGVHRTLPLRVARRLSTEVVDWVNAFRVASRIDILIMAGTGMLTDSGEGPFGLPYDLFRWSIATRACGGRPRLASVGVEPIASPVARFFITAALKLADYRSYRDSQSRDRLRSAGFSSGHDPVYPDLAFSLPEDVTTRPLPAARAMPKVAVGLYDFAGRGRLGAKSRKDYAEYLEKLGSFVLWLLERGHPVRIIVGDRLYDEGVLRDFLGWIGTSRGARFADQLEHEMASSVEQLLEQIADADIVVASRFHNVLLALLIARPVVSLSYNEKNDALLAEMGLGAFCQSIGDFRVDRLIHQFTEVARMAEGLRPSLVERAASYRAALERQYTRLFEASAR